MTKIDYAKYPNLEFKDIRLIPRKSVVESRSACSTQVELGGRIFDSPVVMSNMQSVMTPEICKLFHDQEWFYIYHRIGGTRDVMDFVKYANRDMFYTSISVGIKPEWEAFIETCYLTRRTLDYITVDVAHSHTDQVIPVLRTIRKFYPDAYVILGNGCTSEWATWVDQLGLVNAIKVGIGVSKACRTKEFTGFGSFTASSLIDIVNSGISLDIISDGGITVEDGVTHIGDVAKALALGADFVMSGALFSRCIDNPALVHGYYGNASREAKGNTHVEGATIKVETDGLTMVETMQRIQESLRSSVSYAGVSSVTELFNCPFQVVRN